MPYLAATSAFFLPLSTALMMSIFSSIDTLFFILTGGSGRASAMAPSSVSQARPSAPTAGQAPSLPLRLLSQPAAGSHGHGTWRSWSNLPGGAGGGCHGCDHRHDGLEGPPPSSFFRPGASGSYCYRRRKKIKLERVAGDAPPGLLRPRFPPYVLPSRLLQHDAPGAAAAPPAGEGWAGPGQPLGPGSGRAGPRLALRPVRRVTPRERPPFPRLRGCTGNAQRVGVGVDLARTSHSGGAGRPKSQDSPRAREQAGSTREEAVCWWRKKTVDAV